MIIANYGTGTPAEAADWVRYANVTKGYGVKYWTIGNEYYGNGHYGAAWEADDHADKSPTGYANGVAAYADAMKAVDPTIKVGAVLTTPANWPDAARRRRRRRHLEPTVLSVAGPKIDFVDLHWYPGGGTAAEALTKPEQIDRRAVPGAPADRPVRRARTRPGSASASPRPTSAWARTPSRARCSSPTPTQRCWSNGVFTVHWWNVHNGIGTVSTVAGQTDYGDFGLLSSGNCLADGVDLRAAAEHAVRAVPRAVDRQRLRARPVTSSCAPPPTEPLVSAHAARRPNGDLAVLLVNKDPDNAHPVAVDYAGFTPAAAAPTVYSYTNGATAVSTAQTGTATSQTLPPYSLTALVLHPARAAAGPPGGARAADRQRGHRPVRDDLLAGRRARRAPDRQVRGVPPERRDQRAARRDHRDVVHRRATSYPGTRYTVNVLTRDTAGNVSWASPPLTFTTGSPAQQHLRGALHRRHRLGQRLRRQRRHHQHRPEPDRRLDAHVRLAHRLAAAQQRLERHLGAAGDHRHRHQPRPPTASSPPPAVRSTSASSANYSGPNVLPAAFTLNGTLCTVVP